MGVQLSPVDIVLSCTVCLETFSTIYDNDDRIDGLHKDGEGPNDGKITKFWLTECAHFTCGKHLPGGGAPFHSVRDVPRAPCPLCSTEKDDHSDKALFFINGTSKGQYDGNIPEAYFQTPPIQLSGGNPGLEALRFQYLSLLRSGTKRHEKLIGLAMALKRWEDKKPEIVRSLSSVAPLRDGLLAAGRRLMALGEDVSSIENTLKLAGVSLSEGLQPQQQIDIHSQYHKVDLKPAVDNSSPLDGGSRLARGSAADLYSLNQGDGIFKRRNDIPHQDSIQRDGSSSKRKRVNSRSGTQHQSEYAHRGGGFEKCRSRDQMPPPPTPIQQPLVYSAGVPSSDLHKGNAQYNHVSAKSFQRAPITPQRHPSEVGFSRLTLAPSSSIEPSDRLLAGARANNGHLHVEHHHSQHFNAGAVGPVNVRGGWQPPPESFDTERSEDPSSPSSSLHLAGRLPIRHSTGYQQGSLRFPVELGDRSIDPSSRNYQSLTGDGPSSYYRRQSPLAMQFQLESPAHLRTGNLSSNRESRITFSRKPSLTSQHSSNKGIGLSSHVRSSSRQSNHQSANSSSHRHTPAPQRVSASAHFPTRQRSSLFSLGGPYTETFHRNNSLDSGPRPVNGEMRLHSSTNGECIVLTQGSRVAQTHGMAHFMESQASGARRRANRR